MDAILEFAWLLFRIVLFTLLPLILLVAYYTYAERKVIGAMQSRIGPNRVGPLGLFQPFADVIKLLLKEIILPKEANRYLFLIAPILAIAPAFGVWAVVPVGDGLVWADLNAGVLYILALSSMGVYGIILAGWASNSKYALLGAMRAAAQMVSYEIALGFSLLGVMILAGSLNLQAIVNAQSGGMLDWYWLPLLPMFLIFFISALAETNRAPFDMAEGESEIVAGFHVDYAGASFAVFFLAEYANMILMSALTAIFFFGGWLSPFEGWAFLGDSWLRDSSIFWFLAKLIFFMFNFLWIRATFPRYRYDQVMRLGWKIFIPIAMVWMLVAALFVFNGIVVRGA
ncbi:MAG: NADH-quinone oxidoreductase subunit NuoH [Xanthomonadales bacterium]|nr:NADH-quinone oxidoreductase subunit NuoH [Xanthomonadales bacterium]